MCVQKAAAGGTQLPSAVLQQLPNTRQSRAGLQLLPLPWGLGLEFDTNEEKVAHLDPGLQGGHGGVSRRRLNAEMQLRFLWCSFGALSGWAVGWKPGDLVFNPRVTTEEPSKPR